MAAGVAVADDFAASGVRRKVAADEACLGAHGISRVKEALLRGGAAEVVGDDPRFDDGDAVDLVYLQYPVHTLKREDDAASERHRTSVKTAARAARRYGDFMFIGDFHYFRDVFGAFWEEEQLRGIFFVVGVLRHLVVRVGLQFFFVRADVVRAYFFFKGRGDFRRNFIVRKDIVH